MVTALVWSVVALRDATNEERPLGYRSRSVSKEKKSSTESNRYGLFPRIY